jgi:hypothetical protein
MAKLFFPKGLGQQPGSAWGAIEEAGRFDYAVESPILAPIWTTFRGMNANTSPYPVTEWKPTGEIITLDGITLLEYGVPAGHYLGTLRIGVDPLRNYVARVVQRFQLGTLIESCTISYRDDPEHGWVPDSWIHTQFSRDGDVVRSWRVDDTSWTINWAIPQEQFDITFPVGAIIHDRYKLRSYRVEPNGDWHEMTAADLKLLESEPWYWEYLWWLIGGAAVLAAILGFIGFRLWKRRGRRRSPAGP